MPYLSQTALSPGRCTVHVLCLSALRVGFKGAAESWAATGACRANVRSSARDGIQGNDLSTLRGAAYRALTSARTARRSTTFAIRCFCAPARRSASGKIYQTALANPALRPLLWRAGLPELRRAIPVRGTAGALMRRARRCISGLVRDRSAGGGATGIPSPAAPRPKPMPARSRRPTCGSRKNHPHLRPRICCARLQQRLYSDLCGLQPDRRSGCARPGTFDGADRSPIPAATRINAAVQPGADFHRAFTRGELINPPPWRGIVRTDGSRCRFAIARPITMRFSRGAAKLHRDRPRIIAATARPRAIPTWSTSVSLPAARTCARWMAER